MRSKTPLAMMEQIIMVLVFALAAALCLRAFVWSDQVSRSGEERDRAAVLAQSAAETIKHEGERTHGAAEDVLSSAAETLGAEYTVGAALELRCGGDDDGEDPLILRAEDAGAGDDPAGLAKVRVFVADEDPENVIFEITVAWQTEVSGA